MTRLGRLAHLHGNYIASLYCQVQLCKPLLSSPPYQIPSDPLFSSDHFLSRSFMETLCLACSLCWILIFPCLSTSQQPPPQPSSPGLSCLFLSEPMGVLLESHSALAHASLAREFGCHSTCRHSEAYFHEPIESLQALSWGFPHSPPIFFFFFCLFRNANALASSLVNITQCTAHFLHVQSVPFFSNIPFSFKNADGVVIQISKYGVHRGEIDLF